MEEKKTLIEDLTLLVPETPYLKDEVNVVRLKHAAPARGHDHAPVPARCLQVGVEGVF